MMNLRSLINSAAFGGQRTALLMVAVTAGLAGFAFGIGVSSAQAKGTKAALECPKCECKCDCGQGASGAEAKSAGDRGTGDKSAGDKSAGDKPPTGDKSAADKPDAGKGGDKGGDKTQTHETHAESSNTANASRLGLIKDFAPGTPDGILREAFKCALEMDETAGFSCYARLNVEGNHDNDIATTQLRNYQWRFFRQRASSYVMTEQPFTIKVTRRDPGAIDANSKEVKVFLLSKARDNPAPVTLRKEGNVWRIYSNSL